MKCFIGLIDIASQINDWRFGFNKLGIDTLSAVTDHDNVMFKNNVDYKIGKMFPFKFWPGVRPRTLQAYLQDRANPAKNYVFRKALKECDVFIYIFRPFYKDFRDFEEIRNRGKKIVYIYTGGHERWYYAAKQEFEKHGMLPLEMNPDYYTGLHKLEESLNIVRNVEKYANCIWSLPEQSQLFFRPYYRFNIPLQVNDYSCEINQREIPLIIHAPSSPKFKGTEYVLNAVDKLRAEGVKFNFELVHNLPHNIAIQKYKNCDIIINQLLVPGGGKLAIEGLALGKIMLTFQGYGYNYDQKTPVDCPIIDVDPTNIADKLRDIIVDWNLRKRIAGYGPEYIKKYHSAEKCAEKLLLNLEDNNTNPEFSPTFFRNDFIPESDQSVDIYNKWTRSVKDCDWFKNIKPGVREGLIF